MARSQGDPRVLVVMNLLLSAAFCYVALRGLAFVGAVEFSWLLFAAATAGLVVITHLVTR
ncbi:hypothetical protein [Halalkalicoccus jeotgali]|uniref:DUF8107 domain-containing protein n=1 Tax=Halalkalicoccus jeotgali (strain DSM 18796 / CECT 7217 / JCM 14584 / KCTC 4019 / B3) TaxID=795797 RepID=D8J914_HALJB|nr:hypothetical protein [Halalkalicoccus jeotgali]ADJ16283.1 hypothetical protein HacjB3_14510 [Halalkalicoccus jeotgali B3]ELY37017.1 hypothetical protein C497_09748 [Halalkalicoccus jeotgali B3]